MSLETEMRVFVEVIRHRSFARAAQALGISRPTASRLFRAFEERFAPQLATRTPQRMQLFPLGNAIFERAEAIVLKMDELMRLSRKDGKPHAKVTIACSPELALGLVNGVCRSFAGDNPHLDVQVVDVPGDRVALAEEVDVLLSFGPAPVKSRFSEQRLADEGYVFVASAAATKLHQKPESFERLAAARFIWIGERAGPVSWQVSRRRDHWESVELTPAVIEQDCEFVLDAVKAGLGAGILPNWLVATGLADGGLVRAFPGWKVASTRKQRRLVAYVNPLSPSAESVRGLLDIMKARLMDIPAGRPRTGFP